MVNEYKMVYVYNMLLLIMQTIIHVRIILVLIRVSITRRYLIYNRYFTLII